MTPKVRSAELTLMNHCVTEIRKLSLLNRPQARFDLKLVIIQCVDIMGSFLSQTVVDFMESGINFTYLKYQYYYYC